MGCGASTSSQLHRTPSALLSDLQGKLDRGELTAAHRRDLIRIANRVAAAGTVYSETASPTPQQKSVESSSPVQSARHTRDGDALYDLWSEVTNTIEREEFGRRFHDILERDHADLAVFFDPVGSADRKALLAVRMIEQVVIASSDQGSATVTALLASGARHCAYGVDAAALSVARDIAARVIDSAIERPWTEHERSAWDDTWSTALNLMRHGMTSADGINAAQRFEATSIRVVEAAWNKIRLAQTAHTDPDKRVFARAMYAAALARQGELGERFSNLRDFRTSDAIMDFITTSIDLLAQGRREETMDQLRELGARHVNYGLSKNDLSSFEVPFVDTCAFYLKDGATRQVLFHLQRYFRFLVHSMMAGFTSNRDAGNTLQAPKGSGEDVTVVFTDIEKSTKLWATNPTAMSTALERHNAIIRRLIRRYNGYEVKTVGDSFMIAFSSAAAAVCFACDLQIHLLTAAPIAPGFIMTNGTQAGTAPADCWNNTTLRVRVGIATSNDTQATFDHIHRRYDYFGPGVNLAARIESVACGGQILMCTTTAQRFEQAQQQKTAGGVPRYFRDLEHAKAATGTRGGVPRQESVESPSSSPPGTLEDRDDDVEAKSAVVVTPISEPFWLRGVPTPVLLSNVAPMCLQRRHFPRTIDNVQRSSGDGDSTAVRSQTIRRDPVPTTS